MLREYTIPDLIPELEENTPFHAHYFSGNEDLNLEWPHRNSFYSIVWFMRGAGFNVIDFNEYAIPKNRMFLISPEHIHNWTYATNSAGYAIMFDKSVASQLDLDFLFQYADIKKQDRPLIKLVIEDMIRSCTLTDAKPDPGVEAGLLYLHTLICRNNEDYHCHSNSDETKALFRKLKELILTGGKMQSMDMYADELQISTPVLNQICQECTGSSTKQLVLDIQITEAKRLLIYSQMNINEISWQLGFEDPSYFARIFKKKTLLSPTSFLKKYQK